MLINGPGYCKEYRKMKHGITLFIVIVIWNFKAQAVREVDVLLSYTPKKQGQLLTDSAWGQSQKVAEKMNDDAGSATAQKNFDKEISLKYERDFGLTPQYQLNNLPRSIWFNQLGVMGLSEELMIQKQQQFGDYVVRKIGEFQLERLSNKSEAIKRAAQLKDKVTQAKVTLEAGTEFQVNYSLGGQFFDLTLKSSLAEAHLILSHADLKDPVSLIIKRQFARKYEFKSQVKVNSQHSQSSVSYRVSELSTLSVIYNVTRTLGVNDSSYLMGWAFKY